jgi:hypothetical protein
MTTWGGCIENTFIWKGEKANIKKEWNKNENKNDFGSWDCAQTQKAIQYISWFNDWTILFHEIIFENFLIKKWKF